MRPQCIAPFLFVATSLSAQVSLRVQIEPVPVDTRARVQVEAAPTDTYGAALSLLTDWGFSMQLAEADNGVIVTNNLELSDVWIGNVRKKKLLGQRPGYWIDCGKDWPFSLAASAEYVNFQFTILITGDSSASNVKVALLASAIWEEGSTPCYSRKRLEPLFVDSLRARLTGAP